MAYKRWFRFVIVMIVIVACALLFWLTTSSNSDLVWRHVVALRTANGEEAKRHRIAVLEHPLEAVDAAIQELEAGRFGAIWILEALPTESKHAIRLRLSELDRTLDEQSQRAFSLECSAFYVYGDFGYLEGLVRDAQRINLAAVRNLQLIQKVDEKIEKIAFFSMAPPLLGTDSEAIGIATFWKDLDFSRLPTTEGRVENTDPQQ